MRRIVERKGKKGRDWRIVLYLDKGKEWKIKGKEWKI
jgi:hypothetical protein